MTKILRCKGLAHEADMIVIRFFLGFYVVECPVCGLIRIVRKGE